MSEQYGWILVWTQVSVPRSYDDLAFVWQGGNTIRLTRGNSGLLDFDPYGILSSHAPEVGDVFTYGPFTLRCTVSEADYIEAAREKKG